MDEKLSKLKPFLDKGVILVHQAEKLEDKLYSYSKAFVLKFKWSSYESDGENWSTFEQLVEKHAGPLSKIRYPNQP